MTDPNVLGTTVNRIFLLVDHYRRDAPFRAPETVPEHQARLLNQIYHILEQGKES